MNSRMCLFALIALCLVVSVALYGSFRFDQDCRDAGGLTVRTAYGLSCIHARVIPLEYIR